MDPASESSQNLGEWAKEMWYLLPNGLVPSPSHFASATSTQSRRRLWKQVTNRLKDRRIIRQINTLHTEEGSVVVKNSPVDKLDILKATTHAAGNDLRQLQQKITQRINKIRSLEENTREVQTKTLLFNSIRNANIKELAMVQQSRSCIQKLTCVPDIKQLLAMNFLEVKMADIRRRLCDPAIPDEINNSIKDSNMVDDGLWHALIQNSEKLINDCLLKKVESKDRLFSFRYSMGSPPTSWMSHIAKQRLKVASRNAVTVLLRGVGLCKMAEEPFQLEHEILSLSLDDFYNEDINENYKNYNTNEIGVEKLQATCSSCQKAYEELKQLTDNLLSKHTLVTQNSLELRRLLKKKVDEFKLNVTGNAAEWRSLMQTHSSLIHQHHRIIYQLPLSQLRVAEKSNSPKKLLTANGAMYNYYNSDAVVEIDIQALTNLLQELDKLDSLTKNSDLWRKLIRSLERIQEKALMLNDSSQKIKRIIQIYCDQPFSNMIPSTYTVSNLTYKDWELECNLTLTPRRKF